ncbi:MAG: hypothetical protein V7K26_00745 [Nostoc sp.]|uniref:hypothetical protein n=1 Tax=Nostoc sp. TaxID=1180 RepID=UPI002FF06780
MYVFHKLPEIEDLECDRFLIRYWEIWSDRLWLSTRLSSIHSAIASNNKIYQRSVDDESAKMGKNWTTQKLSVHRS